MKLASFILGLSFGVAAMTAYGMPRATDALTPEPAQPFTPAKAQMTQHSRVPFAVKRCINLGNALEAEREGAWGYTIQVSHLDAIKRAGFDTVRLPVRWDHRTTRTAPFKIDPAYMARVSYIVSEAQKRGLGVIIDVHHFEGMNSDPIGHTRQFLAIWDQVATHFSTASNTVYFEVLNEALPNGSPQRLSQIYTKAVRVIRRTNPTRPLILGGTKWNSVDELDDLLWPDDPNIVATFHDYGPYEFTHQGASWADAPPPLGRTWGSLSDTAELRDTYTQANRFKADSGLPVFVGELGVINAVPEAQRATWLKTRRQHAEKSGMSWCAWDFAGAFALYDVNKARWKPGMLDALFRD